MLIPKGRKVKRIKPKRLQDKKHLAYVASHPCCCCGRKPVQVHHLLRGVARGMGLKAGDNWTIPLCHGCHILGVHTEGEGFYLEMHGVYGRKLAKELWEKSQCVKRK